MIKKLLLTSILVAFSVLSSKAQVLNLLIDSAGKSVNKLKFGWAKGYTAGDPVYDGTGWTYTGFGSPMDSLGAVGKKGTIAPYDGAEQMEFNYNTSGWWCQGQFRVDKNWAYSGLGQDYSAYTHLKLYWLGFSAGTPGNLLTFQLADPTVSGPQITVFDNCNQLTYVEKIVPLTQFLNGTLTSLSNIVGITYTIGNIPDDPEQGVFYMDAVQLVKLTDSVMVEGFGYAATPGDTITWDSTEVNLPITRLFKISNVKNFATLNITGVPVISGADAADFTITSNPATSVSAGSAATFNIKFNPGSLGWKNAILTVPNDFSAGGNYVIKLRAKAVSVTSISSPISSTDTYAAYPTPFTDETVIKVNSTVDAPMSIKVMDTKGTLISTSEGHYTNEDIALGKGLEKGVYFVHVIYQNRLQVIKIVKM